MEGLESVSLEGPPLTKEERLEILELQLLFARAPGHAQAEATRRVNPLIESGRVDSRELMRTVRDVSAYLRAAVDPASGAH